MRRICPIPDFVIFYVRQGKHVVSPPIVSFPVLNACATSSDEVAVGSY